MSHEDDRDPETGLKDVYETLAKAPQERLLSLTFQLGESPEDTVVHALCLLLLRKEAQALSKLQLLEDNSLACHLAERWQASECEREDLAEHCGRFQALTGESLASLARIFRVLTQQRLCDPRVRDLAYKRAVSSDCQKTSTYDQTCYDRFREEAKSVCGPELVEWICSPAEPERSTGSPGSLDERMMALKVTEPSSQSPSTRCLPSPLQASVPSFPSHLEISIPPTLSFQRDRLPSEESGDVGSAPPTLALHEKEANPTPGPPPSVRSQPESTGSPRCEDAGPEGTSAAACASTPTSQPTSLKSNVACHVTTSNPKMHESDDEDEEEEDVFYAFVVLHAQEDAEKAETIKDKLEAVASCRGATFNGDFAIPGRSTLRCVEDAINNSAFTFLLLTRNFNTRMLSLKTNAALMNSINNEHKYNTVIPLLPKENPMPDDGVPMVLRSFVALREDKNFERKIKQLLNRAKIERLRRRWTEDRRSKTAPLRPPEPEREPTPQDGRIWRPQASNITIQNANYIMIGNQSQMTVGLGENANQGD